MHLRAYLSSTDQFYIVKIDLTEHQGWMPKWIWDWLNKDRGQPLLPGLANQLTNPTNPLFPPPPPFPAPGGIKP
jgi:hypothetical protein